MKNFRLLVVSGWYPSLLEPLNGDFIKEQIRILRSRGWKVDFVYADHNIRYIQKGQVVKIQSLSVDESGNYDFISSGPTLPKNSYFGLRNWISNYSKLATSFIENYHSPNLILAHTYLGFAVAARITNEKNVPIMGIEHYTGWLDSTFRTSHLSLAKSAISTLDKAYAVSHSLAHKMEGLFSLKVDVLPNVIDTNLFHPSSNSNSTLTLIGIGDLIERKQWNDALKAIHLISKTGKKVCLHLVGDGNLKSILKNKCISLRIESVVTFHGVLPKLEVAELLRKSDILIHTSHTETFGIVYAEALSSGIPVVSYNNDGIHEFKDCLGVTITEERSADSLAKAIQECYEATFSKSNIRYSFLQSFGEEKTVSSLEKDILQLTSRDK